MRNTLIVLAVLTAGAACAAEMKMDHSAPAAGGSPSDRAYAEVMNTMMKDMQTKPTGDADRDFVSMMLPHHQGAVAMAQIELQYGKDPELLAMARAIVAAQEKEIAEMREWQNKHTK